MASQGRAVTIGSTSLKLQKHDDLLSSYWETDATLNEVMEVVERLEEPAGDSPVALDGDDPQQDIDYSELRETTETPAPFVAVYTDDYVVSWEKYGDDARIGIRSENDIRDFVLEVFEETTGNEASSEDYDVMETFAL